MKTQVNTPLAVSNDTRSPTSHFLRRWSVKKIFEHVEAGEASIYAPTQVVLETYFLVTNGTIKPMGSFCGWWCLLDRPQLVHIEMTHDGEWGLK